MEFHDGVHSSKVKIDYVCCTPSILKGAFHSSKTCQGKNVIICLSPSPLPPECCLRVAGREFEMFLASVIEVSVATLQTYLIQSYCLSLSCSFMSLFILAPYWLPLCLQMGPAISSPIPQNGGMSLSSPQVSRKDCSQNHIKAQVLYLQETLKGNLKVKKTEAQKGSGCPHITAGLGQSCECAYILHTSESRSPKIT